MENLINTLLWTGMIAGGFMVLLLSLSMLSGFDIDGDADFDSGSDDHGGDGGLGLVKSLLTFVSVGSFTARAMMLNSDWSWWIALISGVLAGIGGILLLSMVLKFLLGQQEEGNYEFWEAEGNVGSVYIPIPKNGIGKITVEVNGYNRELPARSKSGEAIASGQKVMVLESEEAYLIVTGIN